MKVEAWVFGSLTIFMIIVTPIYWLITADANGSARDHRYRRVDHDNLAGADDLGLPPPGGGPDGAEA